MQPLGRKPIRPPWKTDHHPRRQHGWKNWWEVELNDGPNKTAEKEAAKKEIDNAIDEWHNSESELSLIEFLNISEEEYKLWVSDASNLPKGYR